MSKPKYIPPFLQAVIDNNLSSYVIPEKINLELENTKQDVLDILLIKENIFEIIRHNFDVSDFFENWLTSYSVNSIRDNSWKLIMINQLFMYLNKNVDLDFYWYNKADFRFCNRYKTEVLVRNIWWEKIFKNELLKNDFDFSISSLKNFLTNDIFFDKDGEHIDLTKIRSKAWSKLNYYWTFLKYNLSNKYDDLKGLENDDKLFIEKLLYFLYWNKIEKLSKISPEKLKKIFWWVYSFLDFDWNIISKSFKDNIESKEYWSINYFHIITKIIWIKPRNTFTLNSLVEYIYWSLSNFWLEVDKISKKSKFNFNGINELKDFFVEDMLFLQKSWEYYVNEKYWVFKKDEFLNDVFKQDYILELIPEWIIIDNYTSLKNKKQLLSYILFWEENLDFVISSIKTTKKNELKKWKINLNFSNKNELRDYLWFDFFISPTWLFKKNYEYPSKIIISDEVLAYSKSEFFEKFLSALLEKDFLVSDYNSWNTDKFSKFAVKTLFPEKYIELSEKMNFDKTNISDLKKLFNENIEKLKDDNWDYNSIDDIIFESKIFKENIVKWNILWINLKEFIKPDWIEKVDWWKDATKWLVEEYLQLKN